jgi:flagellar assembly protein FliH
MAAVSKFLFEHSFDVPGASVEEDEERFARRHTARELAAARTEGFEAGRQAGLEAALAGIEAETSRIMEAAAREIAALAARHGEAARAMLEAGLELAAAIAAKAMPELARRHGLAEIEALVTDCLGGLVDEPRVVIRVHDSLLDPLQARAEALARQAGFEGKLVLLADSALGPADCRIEWADGGVARNLARLLAEIDDTVARALGKPAAPAAANASHA